MSQKTKTAEADVMESGGPAAATAAPARAKQAARPRHLPQYRVILHNDDKNTVEHVIQTLVDLTPLDVNEAVERTVEAHESGCALLLVTHRERAELYVEQFQSASLTVTIEPTE